MEKVKNMSTNEKLGLNDLLPLELVEKLSRIKTVFFVQGANTPSSRFRVYQLLPALSKLGIQSTVLAPNPSVAGDEFNQKRIQGVLKEFIQPLSIISRIRQIKATGRHQVAYIQKPMIYYPIPVFEEIVARWRPTIFDFDDAIFHRLLGLQKFKVQRISNLCKHIVVGNQYLANFIGNTEKTTVIPTVVDTQRYIPRPDPEGPFTIGWTGVASNLCELRPLASVLETVLRETKGRLLIVAEQCKEKWLHKLPMEFIPWSPKTEVEALARMHVGLMPLRDTPFNRGKCGFKLIQYQARGIPVIASPLGANLEIIRSEVNGFLAQSPNEWKESLMTLAQNPKTREKMGHAGRNLVERCYSIEAVAPKLANLICRVANL